MRQGVRGSRRFESTRGASAMVGGSWALVASLLLPWWGRSLRSCSKYRGIQSGGKALRLSSALEASECNEDAESSTLVRVLLEGST